MVSARNDHHWARFLHSLGINENPACQAPGGSFPSTSCFQIIHRYPVLNARELGCIKPCMLVSGCHCTSLVNLHCVVMPLLFNWPCRPGPQGLSTPWVPSSESYSNWEFISSPGSLCLFPRAWLGYWQSLVLLPRVLLLRLPQPHPCLLPTGNSLG